MSRFSPNNVTNLTANVVSINQIDLSWTNNNPGFEHGATIERTDGNSLSGQFQSLVTVAANVTSYSDTTTKPGTAYQFRVTPISVEPMYTPASGVIVSATTPGQAPHSWVTGGLSAPSLTQHLVIDGQVGGKG